MPPPCSRAPSRALLSRPLCRALSPRLLAGRATIASSHLPGSGVDAAPAVHAAVAAAAPAGGGAAARHGEHGQDRAEQALLRPELVDDARIVLGIVIKPTVTVWSYLYNRHRGGLTIGALEHGDRELSTGQPRLYEQRG